MKNKQKGFIIPAMIAIVLILAIGGGGYTYLENKKVNNNKIDNIETSIQSTSTNIINSNNHENILSKNCIENDKYYIISKETENIGSNFLIKYKDIENKNIECKYVKENNDFEIKDDEIGFNLIGLENNHLILDSGTGPNPRGLTIYDLSTKKEVYSTIYSSPIKINQNIVSYWNPTKKTASNENCPQFKQNTANQFGSIIEEYVNLDLKNLTKISTGKLRCSATQ